ncbi:MAG TPA: class E sortase [Candidatus Paceibacterota bacterium]|nr:class E sortase [Candidatus Paceibacterota bacterium]
MKWYKRPEATFSFLFLGIFLVTFVVLYAFGLIPTELKEQTGTPNILNQLSENSIESITGENNPQNPNPLPPTDQVPLRIQSDVIGLNYQVINPSSTGNTTLDNALTEGAVHYPGSGLPGYGNMFIFGHSTGFKVVNNKAYQVFNNIHNLKEGDQIKVLTKDRVYFYTVASVKLEKDTNAYVSFSTKQNILTLSTCNSFGAKEDRYVVVATYAGTAPIGKS